MSHLDKKVFGKKSYSDLLKEIYDILRKSIEIIEILKEIYEIPKGIDGILEEINDNHCNPCNIQYLVYSI